MFFFRRYPRFCENICNDIDGWGFNENTCAIKGDSWSSEIILLGFCIKHILCTDAFLGNQSQVVSI